MKNIYALFAFLSCAFTFLACEKAETLDLRTFVFSDVEPAIPATGISTSGETHTFTVVANFGWVIDAPIVEENEDADEDDESQEDLSTTQTDSSAIAYDGYTVTQSGNEITVVVESFDTMKLHIREVIIDFVSTDGKIRAQWRYCQYGDGDGSAATPFYISTAEQLTALATLVNGVVDEDDATNNVAADSREGKYYELICDIDLKGGDSNQWTPIGGQGYPFKGHFNGGGYEISGLYINTNDTGFQGLFGHLGDYGTISNLGLRGTIFVNSTEELATADSRATRAQDGSTENYNIAGIVGYTHDGTIFNCYNHCNVTCSGSTTGRFGENVGGIVGYSYGGTIENCYNTGAITGINNFVGGIVGCSKGSITSCYNVGYINSSSVLAGGIAGGAVGSNLVTNCYTLQGSVRTGTNVGDTELEGDIVAGKDGTLKSEAYMQSVAFVTDLVGSIWTADSTTEPINDGYPIFTWQR